MGSNSGSEHSGRRKIKKPRTTVNLRDSPLTPNRFPAMRAQSIAAWPLLVGREHEQ
jgi:hypothetical protein